MNKYEVKFVDSPTVTIKADAFWTEGGAVTFTVKEPGGDKYHSGNAVAYFQYVMSVRKVDDE